MKKIIVAIDFSTCSIHALEYAISLANIINANIQLVWVDNVIVNNSDFDIDLIPQESRKDKSKNLNDIVEKYKDKLNGELSYRFRKGKIYQEISLLAKAEKADLMVIGTHGVSGFEEYWIGSNAYRIVTHSPCPVITLRQQFDVKDKIDKIVIPIDSTSETLDKIKFIRDLAQIFNSEVHIIAVYPTLINVLKRKVELNEQKAIKFFKENKIKFVNQKIVSDKITEVIINYSLKVNADLIGIMTEQSIQTSSVSLGLNAQQLISNSMIPVLNIRPQSNFEK